MSKHNPSFEMKFDESADDPHNVTPAPKVVGRFPSSPPEQEIRIQNLKYIFFAYNLIIFVSSDFVADLLCS